MHMETVRKQLLAVFFSLIAGCVVLAILGETDILPSGLLADDKLWEYYMVGTMELITICTIPLALRLFRFKAVAARLVHRPHAMLLRWGVVRMAMIAVPMTANTLLYYLFMNVAFGYMAIIGLLCLAFVYPSETRCKQETQQPG